MYLYHSEGKVVRAMPGRSAVIFVPDDTAKTGYPQPLMLSRVMGAPLLAWLASSLFDSGVGRFFLACHPDRTDAVCACMPEGAEVTCASETNPADLLHVFLSTADDAERTVLVVTGPAVFLPSLAAKKSRPACVRRVVREELMNVIDARVPFGRFFREEGEVLTDADGMYSVSSPAALPAISELLRRDRYLRLSRDGVEIYDPASCYIEPTVKIAAGAKLLPGTILRGRTKIAAGAVIGPWSTVTDSEIGERSMINASQIEASRVGADVSVGPYAHLRENCRLDSAVHIGNFVELKNASVGSGTWLSHLSYVGDADLGARCNVGCGAVTVNFDHVEKHRTTVGDDAFIGCNTSLVAPVSVGNGAYIAAGSVITEDVPAQALGIARSRQSNKRDWAAKHKK